MSFIHAKKNPRPPLINTSRAKDHATGMSDELIYSFRVLCFRSKNIGFILTFHIFFSLTLRTSFLLPYGLRSTQLWYPNFHGLTVPVKRNVGDGSL